MGRKIDFHCKKNDQPLLKVVVDGFMVGEGIRDVSVVGNVGKSSMRAFAESEDLSSVYRFVSR